MKKYFAAFAFALFLSSLIFGTPARASGECNTNNFMGTSFMC